MTDQISIPTVFMRRGTSIGLLFDKRDLPSEEKEISKYSSTQIEKLEKLGI